MNETSMNQKLILSVAVFVSFVFTGFQANAESWKPGRAERSRAAFVAGKPGGKPMKVCRAKMKDGQWHGGKSQNGNCYVGFGGKEIKTPMAKAQVLFLRDGQWAKIYNKKYPTNMVKFADGKGGPQFVCRSMTPSKQLHVGKLFRHTCYVPFGGKETKMTRFEVLTNGAPKGLIAGGGAAGGATWVRGKVPPNVMEAGKSGGKPLSVCRFPMPNREVHVGKGWNNTCYVGFGGKELKRPAKGAEFLVLGKSSWSAPEGGKPPKGAVEVGKSGGAPMHVCRAKVANGESHPGKLWKGNCYVGYGGKEVKSGQYEVLVAM